MHHDHHKQPMCSFARDADTSLILMIEKNVKGSGVKERTIIFTEIVDAW